MTTAGQPDLTISSGALTATPSTVAQGGSVRLSAWTVRNQGSAASGFFSNGFYLSSDPVITSSDTYLTGNSNNSLAPATSFNWGGPTLTIPAPTTPGTYYIGILVDSGNAVTESSETNNYVSTQITVTTAGQPDLTISSGALTATPSTVAQGGSVQLSAWTVRNQGSAASGSFSNGFYLSSDPVITSSDTYLTGNSNNSLAPGTSFNWGGPTLTIPAAPRRAHTTLAFWLTAGTP